MHDNGPSWGMMRWRSLVALPFLVCSLACGGGSTTPHPGEGPPARIPVVLTTDCGAEMDDQWALAHLALSPKIELRGIITTHAPSLARPAAATSAAVPPQGLAHLPLEQRPPALAGSRV